MDMENTTTMQSGIEAELALPANYEARMTPAVKQRVEQLKLSIDINDKNKITALASEEQANINEFSDSILNGVGTSEIGEAGELLAHVIGDIKGYQADCENEGKGLLGFLKKQKTKLQNLQTKYRKVSDNIDIVVDDLKNKNIALREVYDKFEEMYQNNLKLYEYLCMLIFAGEQVLAEEHQKLIIMQQEAESSGDMMEIQKVADYKDTITRFERKLYNLKLTKTISLQQSPQIRSIMKSAESVSEGITDIIMTAIPIWKKQMAMELGMDVVEKSLNIQNSVKDAVNTMIVKMSEKSKQLTIAAASAAERGVVDMETINILNNNLIESINGSFQIAQKAFQDRKEESKQLELRENELKTAVNDTIVKYIKA